jgi:hypothetical protein
MKKIILSLIVLITIGTFFVACTSDEDNQKGTGNINPIEVGKLHNQYLSQAMHTLNKSSNLSKSSIFMNLDIENLTEAEKQEILDNVSSVSLEQMKTITFSQLNTQLAKNYYEQVDSALDNSNTLQDLNNSIDLVIELINNDLNGTDWDIVMVYAETIKASAEFWFPANKGGLGKAYNYRASKLQSRGKTVSQAKVADWVKADGRGAAYASVTWAVGAALAGGPVAPVTYLAAIVGGALWKSFAP